MEVRWSLWDAQDNAYLMWGVGGQGVQHYGVEMRAYMPAETRALLRSRNVRSAVLLARARFTGVNATDTRLMRLPLYLTF